MTKHLLRAALAAIACYATAADLHDLPRRDIRGGLAAAHAEYPFVVFLEVARPGSLFAAHCTGSLVGPAWVLTAAHCVRDAEPADVEIVWGWPEAAEYRDALSVHLHPDYLIVGTGTVADANYDLALIRLNEPIAAAKRLRLAPLSVYERLRPAYGNGPYGNTPDDVTTLRAVGFAGDKTRLLYADGPLGQCFGRGLLDPFDEIMCLRSSPLAIGEQGDSGGPLLLRAEVDRPEPGEHPDWLLLGALSGDVQVGLTAALTQYVSLARHAQWMQSVTASDSEPPPIGACPVPEEEAEPGACAVGTVLQSGQSCSGRTLLGGNAYAYLFEASGEATCFTLDPGGLNMRWCGLEGAFLVGNTAPGAERQADGSWKITYAPAAP